MAGSRKGALGLRHIIGVLLALTVIITGGGSNSLAEQRPTVETESLDFAYRSSTHEQFGLSTSGSVVIWMEAPISDDPSDTSSRALRTIQGVDLATNERIEIVSEPSAVGAASISGSIVIWEDRTHTCPTCASNILAMNIETGERFEIATGEAHQTQSAISGQIVAWHESHNSSHRLLMLDLESGPSTEVTNFSEGVISQGPAVGDQHIVWSEIERDDPNRLVAYDMDSGETTTITEFVTPGVSYSLSGATLLWSNPQLHMTDLSNGETQLLDERSGISPYLDGDRVIWSSREAGGEPGYNLYGMHLEDRERLLLIEDDGSQTGAQTANGNLIWSSDAEGYSSLHSTSLNAAFEFGHAPNEAVQIDERGAETEAKDASDELPDRAGRLLQSTYKGMHTPNGGGWHINGQPCTGSGCPAIDSLGAPFSPFFGSLLVLHWEGPTATSDLDLQTGRSAPWGPTVADAMEHMQSTWGTRIVVRLSPQHHNDWGPNPSGTITPDHVAQQLIALVDKYPWVEHVQIHNEPNLEWPQSCTACTWPGAGTYTWSHGQWHSDLYKAINDFYSDAWWAINWYKTNHPEPAIRARLQAVEIWSPPMADIYDKLTGGDGGNFYTYIQGMIATYDRMTYHTYPAPNFDTDGQGGIENNSWTKGFNNWVRTEIAGGLRTMITEFGWNPGQLTSPQPPPPALREFGCDQRQHEPWLWNDPLCPTGDGLTHHFDEDLDHFLANHRHGAEAVMVWIAAGWFDDWDDEDRANGIDPSNGNVRDWYHNYQWSNP